MYYFNIIYHILFYLILFFTNISQSSSRFYLGCSENNPKVYKNMVVSYAFLRYIIYQITNQISFDDDVDQESPIEFTLSIEDNNIGQCMLKQDSILRLIRSFLLVNPALMQKDIAPEKNYLITLHSLFITCFDKVHKILNRLNIDPKAVVSLDLSNNNITSVSHEDLQPFQNLQILILNNNKITTFPMSLNPKITLFCLRHTLIDTASPLVLEFLKKGVTRPIYFDFSNNDRLPINEYQTINKYFVEHNIRHQTNHETKRLSLFHINNNFHAPIRIARFITGLYLQDTQIVQLLRNNTSSSTVQEGPITVTIQNFQNFLLSEETE